MTKYNKEVIAQLSKHIDQEDFQTLVMRDGDYYNIHIISDSFKDTESNTLHLQEPVSCIDSPDDYFTETKLLEYMLEHFIWSHFDVDVDSLTLTTREE